MFHSSKIVYHISYVIYKNIYQIYKHLMQREICRSNFLIVSVVPICQFLWEIIILWETRAIPKKMFWGAVYAVVNAADV